MTQSAERKRENGGIEVSEYAWRSLMTQAQAGNQQSYARLLQAFRKNLSNIRGYDDGLILEILAVVHCKLASCTQSQSVLNWLNAIADYKVKQHRLKQFRLK